jgi:hypothetical protein
MFKMNALKSSTEILVSLYHSLTYSLKRAFHPDHSEITFHATSSIILHFIYSSKTLLSKFDPAKTTLNMQIRFHPYPFLDDFINMKCALNVGCLEQNKSLLTDLRVSYHRVSVL